MVKIKRTSEEWRKLIAECESSDQTQEEWCLANEVNLYTYRDRASRLRRIDEEAAKKDSTRGWVEVRQSAAPVSYEPAASIISTGSLIIEAGPFKMTAGTAYPEEKLTAILRGLARSC